jgi:uracil-DNA glycosylase
MIRHAHCPTAEPYVPAEFRSLRVLREAAAECRGCELYKHATQVVFGEGPRKAQVMMVGEVPGDQEDGRAIHSSGRPGAFWTRRCRRRASSGTTCT